MSQDLTEIKKELKNCEEIIIDFLQCIVRDVETE